MSYIYVIGENDGPYKVGRAKEPQKRLADLQTANPRKLRMHLLSLAEDAVVAEALLHKVLEPYRVSGEWFECEVSEIEKAFDAINLSVGDGLSAMSGDPYVERVLSHKGMRPEQFTSWMSEMRNKAGISDLGCARLLDVTLGEIALMKKTGADRRTALACRALLHRMEPYGQD